jgi:hypothetical protein
VLKNPPRELTAEVPNVEIVRELVIDAPADAWTTVYGKVGGTLPLEEIARERPAIVWLQGEIEVSQAGPIVVDVQSAEPLQLWIDAEPFEGQAKIEREFAAGKHTLTFRVEVSAGSHPELKVELLKPAGSPAQFVVVNGM